MVPYAGSGFPDYWRSLFSLFCLQVNILVDEKENVQLTDFGLFGLSQLLQETYANMPPDSRWQAPETIDPEAYSMENGKPTMASDVHAFACTCIEVTARYLILREADRSYC